MNSDLLELFHSINGGAIGWGVIIAAALSLIQISPIQINPWSYIAKHLGRALNGEVVERLDRYEASTVGLKTDLDELRDFVHNVDSKIDEDRAVTARVRILRFNDELLEAKKHSKDSYDQVLSDIDVYEAYCEQHPDFKNNKTKMSASNIKDSYEIRLKKHDFLASAQDYEYEQKVV